VKALPGMLGVALWGGALWLAPPDPAAARAVVEHAVRPAVLPFLWRSLREAERSGSAAEAVTAAHALMALLPQWTDGHLVFAWRFALSADEVIGGDAAERAARRLEAALVFLAEARGRQPEREVDLLAGTSFLVEMAERHHPDLGRWLDREPSVLADDYLHEAEVRAPAGASVREWRIFKVPGLLIALLRRGDRAHAMEVLDAVLERVPEIRDAELREDWGRQLRQVRAALHGEPVDLAELAKDPRLEALVPLLR
jgi:hypothetical protein